MMSSCPLSNSVVTLEVVRLEAVGRGIEGDADVLEPALLHPDDIESVVGVGTHAEFDGRGGNVRARLGRRGLEAIRCLGGRRAPDSGAQRARVGRRSVGEKSKGAWSISCRTLCCATRQRRGLRTCGLPGRLKARNWHSPCNGCANRILSEWADPSLTNVLILASGFAYKMQTCRVCGRRSGDPNAAE